MATVQELEAQVAALKELLQQRSETPAPQAQPVDPLAAARQASQQTTVDAQVRDRAISQTAIGAVQAWQKSQPIAGFGLVPTKKGGS